MNGRQRWNSLETVLESWLEMIKLGKVVAVHQLSELEFPPWKLVPYSGLMLRETIDVFNALVDAIESRMPIIPIDSAVVGILTEKDLKVAKIPPGFAYEFILQARRPRFTFIAPGLTIPTATSIQSQPFFSVILDPKFIPQEYEDLLIPPVLLFGSKETHTAPPSQSPASARIYPNPAFEYPYNALASFPSGLYFSPADHGYANVFEDSVRLVLPYTIGSKGYARTSDGARFGENTESQTVEYNGQYARLYQPGYNPFIETHDVRLVDVLRNWKDMIENGHWRVGRNGVLGGIKEWKNADDAIGWDRFVCPSKW